ncbi:DUF6194 family protein [Sphingobacterium sp. HMA12]|jgi:hypothetical protein|uniref:DUF6194 family protein n=1 Tax=Sphingobacterium sp. HMA12 TaxID=2050894 RepID=UPI000CE9FC10|nr:DUF6194 family protein [Sphingobacterium sp. HMA12]
MSLQIIEKYLREKLDNVQEQQSFGYHLFFYGTDHRLPFVSTADSDNEYDDVSKLNRQDIFRVNIGVSKESFAKLFSESGIEWDFTTLNTFLPHPHYAAQNFICILNPSGEKLIQTLQFIDEAYLIAKKRFDKKQNNKLNIEME